jgi:hypothetical protein
MTCKPEPPIGEPPRMYAPSAESVMVAIMCYHDVWAHASGRVEELHSVFHNIREEEGCGPSHFDRHFKRNLSLGGDASENAAISYVMEQYRIVGDRLGIVLPEPPATRERARPTSQADS